MRARGTAPSGARAPSRARRPAAARRSASTTDCSCANSGDNASNCVRRYSNAPAGTEHDEPEQHAEPARQRGGEHAIRRALSERERDVVRIAQRMQCGGAAIDVGRFDDGFDIALQIARSPAVIQHEGAETIRPNRPSSTRSSPASTSATSSAGTPMPSDQHRRRRLAVDLFQPGVEPGEIAQPRRRSGRPRQTARTRTIATSLMAMRFPETPRRF